LYIFKIGNKIHIIIYIINFINLIDGSKLNPICIFKGKKLPRGQTIPDGIIVWFQEKGWMNSELMKKYIDILVEDRVDKGIDKEPALMVYDSFSGHLEETVKQKFGQNYFNLAVIPGGCTSMCQPLDV
jgi:hypothetical protein